MRHRCACFPNYAFNVYGSLIFFQALDNLVILFYIQCWVVVFKKIGSPNSIFFSEFIKIFLRVSFMIKENCKVFCTLESAIEPNESHDSSVGP